MGIDLRAAEERVRSQLADAREEAAAAGAAPNTTEEQLAGRRDLHLVVTGPAYGIDFAETPPARPVLVGDTDLVELREMWVDELSAEAIAEHGLETGVVVRWSNTVVCGLSRASPFREVLSPGDPLIAIDGVPVGRLDYAHALQRLRLLGSWSTPETPHILTFSISLPAMAKVRLPPPPPLLACAPGGAPGPTPPLPPPQVKAIVKAEVEHLQREEAVDAMSRTGRHGAHWQPSTSARLPPRVGSDLIARQATFASIHAAGGGGATGGISRIASYAGTTTAEQSRAAAHPPWVSPMRSRSTSPMDARVPRSATSAAGTHLRSGFFARSSSPIGPSPSFVGEPPEGSAEWRRQRELREMQRTMREHGNFYASIAGTRGSLGAYFALCHAQEAARLMAAAERYRLEREAELAEAARKRAVSRSRSVLLVPSSRGSLSESRTFFHRGRTPPPPPPHYGAEGAAYADAVVPGGEAVLVSRGRAGPGRAAVSPQTRRGIAPGRGATGGRRSVDQSSNPRAPSPGTARSLSRRQTPAEEPRPASRTRWLSRAGARPPPPVLRPRGAAPSSSAAAAEEERAYQQQQQHQLQQLEQPHEVIRAVAGSRAIGGDRNDAPPPTLLELAARAATLPSGGKRTPTSSFVKTARSGGEPSLRLE